MGVPSLRFATNNGNGYANSPDFFKFDGASAFCGLPFAKRGFGGDTQLTAAQAYFAYWRVRKWQVQGIFQARFFRPPSTSPAYVDASFSGVIQIVANAVEDLMSNRLTLDASVSGTWQAFEPPDAPTPYDEGLITANARMWARGMNANTVGSGNPSGWIVNPDLRIGCICTGLEAVNRNGSPISVGCGSPTVGGGATVSSNLPSNQLQFVWGLSQVETFDPAAPLVGFEMDMQPASEPDTFWQWYNQAGALVWDTTTGAQLADPLG